MKSSMLPNVPRLHGQEAIANLHRFIKSLDEKGRDLTKSQTKTLKKVAEGLIASIESEMHGTINERFAN